MDLKTKFKHIYQGWKNDLFPSQDIKEYIEKLSAERLQICAACPYNSTPGKVVRFYSTCNDCGCILSAKSKCVDEACPQGKWHAVGTEAQDEEIKKLLNDEQSQESPH